MSYSPSNNIFNTNGIELAVSGGIAVPLSASAILFAGVDNQNIVRLPKIDQNGNLYVSGTISSVVAGTQSVTGSVSVIGIATIDNNNHGNSIITNIPASITNATLANSNSSRKGLTIFNNTTKTMYIKYGINCSTSSFSVKITGQGYLEIPFYYSGQIDAIFSTNIGEALITEILN